MPVTNWTGQKKNQSDALAARFGEPLFFCLFYLDEMKGLWYNDRKVYRGQI